MKKILHIALILLVCFGQVACQSKPKQKPLTEYTDEELVYHYKNAPVEAAKDPGYDWSNIFYDTAQVIARIPAGLALLFAGDAAVKSDQAQKRNPGN